MVLFRLVSKLPLRPKVTRCVRTDARQLPGRVDDVSLFVLLRVKQNDDAPETQKRSIKPPTWKMERRRSLPGWVGNQAGVGVRGQTAAAGCGDAQNFLQTHLKGNKTKSVPRSVA